MKSNVIAIAKKELVRFFSNKVSAFTAIVLPGLLIFLMWSVMGSALTGMFGDEGAEAPKVAAVNLPASIEGMASAAGIEIEPAEGLPANDDVRDRIAAGDVNAYVVFPEGFDQAVAAYDPASGVRAPQVEIFFDSSDTASANAYAALSSALNDYESSLSNRFDVNAGEAAYDVSDAKDRTATFIVSIFPMLLLVLLFTGCMSVAAESVAGEKERGTMATLLAAPVRRSDIALGKVLALALIGLAIAISSAAGIVAGLSNLMQGQMDINVYGPSEYVPLVLVILSTTLVMVVLIALVSALAKTTKEAQLYLTPLMIVVVGVGLLGMFGDAKTDAAYYLIPLYNSVQCMIGILTFDFQPLNVALCVVSNVAAAAVGIAVLQRMFGSERLMFAR